MLTPDLGEILAWVRSLPAPARVAYEAGPTGFGLARFMNAVGVECLVAARRSCSAPTVTGSRPRAGSCAGSRRKDYVLPLRTDRS